MLIRLSYHSQWSIKVIKDEAQDKDLGSIIKIEYKENRQSSRIWKKTGPWIRINFQDQQKYNYIDLV